MERSSIVQVAAGTYLRQEKSCAPGREPRDGAALPHGGCVLRNGDAGGMCGMEFSLHLASNPAFTGGVLVACARAVCRAAARGEVGCRTLFDIPPADLLPDPARARETLL